MECIRLDDGKQVTQVEGVSFCWIVQENGFEKKILQATTNTITISNMNKPIEWKALLCTQSGLLIQHLDYMTKNEKKVLRAR